MVIHFNSFQYTDCQNVSALATSNLLWSIVLRHINLCSITLSFCLCSHQQLNVLLALIKLRWLNCPQFSLSSFLVRVVWNLEVLLLFAEGLVISFSNGSYLFWPPFLWFVLCELPSWAWILSTVQNATGLFKHLLHKKVKVSAEISGTNTGQISTYAKSCLKRWDLHLKTICPSNVI